MRNWLLILSGAILYLVIFQPDAEAASRTAHDVAAFNAAMILIAVAITGTLAGFIAVWDWWHDPKFED